ncbi:MAG: two-component regulator propeller domain-containing protein [Bacteroidota bacterium]|nr:two-component regulator propeller domain-containing protein [Bacteroidota bacterium]
MKRFILGALILLNFYPLLDAQTNQPNPIKKITTADGLSCNFIYSIIQDRKGLIWISTEEGLNVYNGKYFTQYSVNRGRRSLSHNRAQTLLLAPDGNIWTGTSDGLNIYDYRTDSIIQVKTTTAPLRLVYNDITYLAPSQTKRITWIGTYGNGINYFDWKSQTFHVFHLPALPGIPQPLYVMSLLEDDTRRLWIGTNHTGLYRYDLDSKELVYFRLPENSQFIRSLYQDSFRRIWIGTSKGLYLYNETTGKLELVTNPNGLGNTSIGVIKEDSNGKIWIGTELFLMNFSVRSFSMKEPFPYQMIKQGDMDSKLNCPSINALYADKDNNIWVGTAWGGVNMLKGAPQKFRLFKHEQELKSSLPSSSIMALCPDREKFLYVSTMGSSDNRLCKIDINDGRCYPVFASHPFSTYICQTLLLDSKKNLWAGTYNKGLYKINLNGSGYKQFQCRENDPNSILSDDIRCLYEGKDHQIWVGTSNGLVRIDPVSSAVTRVDLNKTKNNIRCIKEGPGAVLWIGTYGYGLITYHMKTHICNSHPLNLSSRVICDLMFHQQTLWIATQGDGLFSYNLTDRHLQHYTESNGLSCNYVKSLAIDKTGKIWMGTSKGISSLIPASGEIENYNAEDGVQGREFYEKAVSVLPNGLFAFGGFGGLNVFNPLHVKKISQCPRVLFTKLMVFNEEIAPDGNERKSPLGENILLADHLVLRHNQSVFTIEFIGINYNTPQKIQYAYTLEGVDHRWYQLGNQNNITFRNLQPGKYLLKVKASSPDGVWSNQNIASIQITIKPPFWRTIWAYLIYLILGGSLLYFIWSFLTIRVHTANCLKIERARREKEEELHQEKIQFFTNVSHEFRTPLTLILTPLEQMSEEETDPVKKKHLNLMLRNARRLLGMVNLLLDFRKTERGLMRIEVKQHDLILLLKEILLTFDELRNRKHIELAFQHQAEVITGWVDAEFINKILFNLLSNSFKFTPDGGKITVGVTEITRATVKWVEITVTDNGIGILPKDLTYIFDRFYQGKNYSHEKMLQGSGIGLHLTKSLVDLHHGSIEVESIPAKRTCFHVAIPIEKAAYQSWEINGDMEDGLVYDDYNIPDPYKFQQNVIVASEERTNAKKRILVVEDNSDIRAYLHSILDMDYIMDEAVNGLDGLDKVSKNDYDLVISDIMMPEMNGIEMCKRLKNSIETDYIPIILLTARTTIENRIEGLSIGADSYIPKPFHPQHLIIRVAKLIELRERLKERYSRKIVLGEQEQVPGHELSIEERFLHKTIDIILTKMIESTFNGDVLASELNISRMGLHRKIKALTGQSTGEFIRTVRLKRACELLQNPEKNISEVCYEVGFNSPSYFSTCFTEMYKMTPSEYKTAKTK